MNADYFDWAATSPVNKDILAEAVEVSLEYGGNPSSIHAPGQRAKLKLEEARSRCAAVLQVKASALIFTSGGTEANHIPILSLLQRPAAGSILISAVEHPAVREQAAAMRQQGWKLISVPCNSDGITEADSFIERIQDDTALICLIAVNNETGAIQPIYETADKIISFCGEKKRPKFHVDAVQAAGKIPLILSHHGIDTAAISAHKIQGPRGTGLLYMANRQEPFIRGGGQEGGLRSGTENLLGIWALTRCLETYALPQTIEKNLEMQGLINTAFIKKLLSLKGCTIIPSSRRQESAEFSCSQNLCDASCKNTDHHPLYFSPWIVQASFAGIPGQVMVRALSGKGFFVSTGSACSSLKNKRPILAAMGVSPSLAANAVRFSFGYSTSMQDIEALLGGINEVCKSFLA